MRDQIRANRQSSPIITGGDIDAGWTQEAEVGDEG
jgi:hypothetical protein